MWHGWEIARPAVGWDNFFVTVSQLRLSKSETRDMADHWRRSVRQLNLGESDEWRMSNHSFFTAFCVIAGALALAALLLAGCGGSNMLNVKLQNGTDRNIKEVYIYKAGSADKGKSLGVLAPNQSTVVAMPKGAVEVYAVSETIKIDEHTRDTPTASQGLELTRPLQVIFYDGNKDKPAATNQPDVIGVSFIVSDKKPAEAAPEP